MLDSWQEQLLQTIEHDDGLWRLERKNVPFSRLPQESIDNITPKYLYIYIRQVFEKKQTWKLFSTTLTKLKLILQALLK